MKTERNLAEAIPYIERHFELDRSGPGKDESGSVIWISGRPGMGKSDMVRQVCREHGWGLKVVYMATLMLEQITGLPVIKDESVSNGVRWSRPEIFNFEALEIEPHTDDNATILFLDDVHLCNRQIQAYLFQLLTYRTIHDHRLPENVSLLLAGNRSSDKAGFQEILAPVANRIFFLEVSPDVDQWARDFAVPAGLRQDVVTFLRHYPEFFSGTPMESRAWPSPRSWTYAARTLDMCGENPARDTMYTVLAGHVGEDAAAKFMEYHLLYSRWDPDLILSGIDVPDPRELNKIQAYAMLSTCVACLLKTLRENGYQTDLKTETALKGLAALVVCMAEYHREIIPLGLKTLILAESSATGKSGIARRLVAKTGMVGELLDVV